MGTSLWQTRVNNGHFFPCVQKNAGEFNRFYNVCLFTVMVVRITRGNLSCKREIYRKT